MRFTKSLTVGIIGVLLFATNAFAAPIEIANINDLESNSTVNTVEKYYEMGNDDYVIKGHIDLSLATIDSIYMNYWGSTLTIDKIDNNPTLVARRLLLDLGGGRIEIIGSTVSGIEGATVVVDEINQKNGVINVYGATVGATTPMGALAVNEILQQRGNINILGGSGENGVGASVVSLKQGERGRVELVAGTGNSSHALVVNQVVQNGTAVIDANGNTTNGVYGMLADEITQRGESEIKAVGGYGDGSHGANVLVSIDQYDRSTIKAIGGASNSVGSYGIAVPILNQYNNSSFEAWNGTSGSSRSYGANIDAVIQNGNSKMTGHGSMYVDPLVLQTTPLAGGYGINIGTITQNDNSTLTGVGGNVATSHGIYVSNIIQNDSSRVVGYGGSGKLDPNNINPADLDVNASGIYVKTLTQVGNRAVITAVGGKGTNNYGIEVETAITIAGSLWIKATGDSPALYVHDSGTLTIEDNATIGINIDFESVPFGRISAKNITLGDNLNLRPVIVNMGTTVINVGGKIEYVFLSYRGNDNNASINAFNDPIDTITMGYKIYVTTNGYSLEIERLKTPATALTDAKDSGYAVTDNQIAFAGKLFDMILGSDFTYNGMLIDIDNMTAIGQATSYIDRILRDMVVQALPLWREIGIREIISSRTELDNKLNDYSVSNTNQAWAIPTFAAGRYNADRPELDSFTDTAIIVKLGGIYRDNKLSLGYEGQLFMNTVKGQENSGSGLGYGIMVALDYRIMGDAISPNVRLSGGYKYRSIDISRRGYNNVSHDAQTTERSITFSLSAGHELFSSNGFSSNVQLGINYVNMRFDGYTESNGGFVVDDNNLNSLELSLNVGAKYSITEKISISGNAIVGYELLNSKMADVVDIGNLSVFDMPVITREYAKLSLNGIVNAIFDLNSYLKLNVGYSFYKRGLYTNNEFKAEFKVAF